VTAPPGRGIIRASWAGTVVFLATSVPLAVAGAGQLIGVVLDGLLFAGGCAFFLWTLALAAARSRENEIGMGGLFFLAGSAPAPVQRQLLGSLATEAAVALATAAARPFTALAFGVLAPMWGLGLCGLWAARYGAFGPRQAPSARGAGHPPD
jgi:hypothetical protein